MNTPETDKNSLEKIQDTFSTIYKLLDYLTKSVDRINKKLSEIEEKL